MAPMEPIPETLEALTELESTDDEGVRLRQLMSLGARAKDVVPDLVGVSIARVDHGLTFTLVASAREIAVLDAIQYAAGGPCVDGAFAQKPHAFDTADVLDEERWRLFSEATAARAVRSTLTLPVTDGDHVIGSVNLYAASGRAFGGHYDELARIFGAWAIGAVANADLSFNTRREAEATPSRLRERHAVEEAATIIAGERDVDLEAAEEILHDSATQAGVDIVELARQVLRARGQREDNGNGA
ncbi:GAF domain-containing protein [Nocardioides sp. CER19]|uniref:GAF domain-containing protein n=1 Tax=Nocardioides sp. CER19 TaxID=3038538 RepID=UPI002447373D|nr:GAF domain-containing protein [Nocardioides sp. CER19]MDH2414467.1 GAF domain-containing protein [Nocardioides sp. CER19]